MQIKISPGNSKMGKIPNIPLPPIVTCPNDAPCIDGGCYALKACRMYPNVKAAWDYNYLCYLHNPIGYFDQIVAFVQRKNPRLFRFHVSGDIVSQGYLEGMFRVADACKNTKFLAFTKRHELDFSGMPINLSIVASFWPHWGDLDSVYLPRAWMQDGNETRIPNDAVECFGNCDSCGVCWSLAKIGKDVYFHKH